MRPGSSAVLLALLAFAGQAAAGPYELRLRGGEKMRASEAVLKGESWLIELPSGIQLTLPKASVLELRELDPALANEEPRATGLNYVTPTEAPPRGGELEPASEDDRRLTTTVSGLRAQRRLAEAEALLRSELVERPGDALRLVLLGQTLVDADRFTEALTPLRQASVGSDESLARARDLTLSEAYSRLDRMDEALRTLESTPEDAAGSVAAARQLLRQDQLGSEALERVETLRFSLHLPAGTGRLDTQPLLQQLDAAWDELEAALGGAPGERVVVVIYPGQEFWETTGMGVTVGGLYDGKVRVPSGSLDPPSPRLAAVLRHELAHAFVDALTSGRADAVWQEGIAEHFERSDLIPALERRLADAHRAGDWPPRYDHATAHSRLEFFLDRHGMSGLRDLLREWHRRGDVDAALHAIAGDDETALEQAWAMALRAKGGR